MHLRGERKPFLYEIYSSPRYRGIECALWPALYFRTSLCESVLEGQNNRVSGKISYMHKVLSPVVDYAINYDILQYQYDRWLFKTITGAVNASKASGCSPNRSLENKSFSETFWQHQHLFLIDAVHQYGFPSLFITISPYEWTFPFPPFIQHIRNTYGKDATEVAVLETIHIAHVLEQLVRGYLTGGNSNRWRTHVLCNVDDPASKNVKTFFYRFEFQQRGTLHLHMLVWFDQVSSIRADLLHASVPWDNAHDAFLVAHTQKSNKSCLPLKNGPDSFITDANGNTTLEFHYTEDDAQRNIQAYITTLLGSLKCRTDVQLADGKAMLLKYVSSYVTKMHDSVTSEGLYCNDVTGYQAAHSFLRTVTPLEPEMVFQLSNIKVWTDKMTMLFRPPFPDQTTTHKVYQMYLQRPGAEEDQSLLQWLRCHQTSTSKPKPYHNDRVLVGVKYVSLFNPLFFYQHLTMHYPHRNVHQLHHPDASTMPSTIAHFAQSAALTPESWNTADAITAFFQKEGHKDYFINTIVSYVHSLTTNYIFGGLVWLVQISPIPPPYLLRDCIHCRLIKTPSSQTSQPLSLHARPRWSNSTHLLTTPPPGRNFAYSWENRALGNPKFSSTPYVKTCLSSLQLPWPCWHRATMRSSWTTSTVTHYTVHSTSPSKDLIPTTSTTLSTNMILSLWMKRQ